MTTRNAMPALLIYLETDPAAPLGGGPVATDNRDAVRFLQHMNAAAYAAHPGVFTVAEESTAWAGVTALLRDRFNANEILVSLMLVYVATLTLSYLVYGPWKDPAGFNFPQTRTFERVTQIPRLWSGSRVMPGRIP